MSRATRLTAAVLAAALTIGLAGQARAVPPTDDPATAAGYGARWVAAQVAPGGYLTNSGGDPSVSPTVQGALALAAAGVEGETFGRMLAYIEANAESYIDQFGDDSPGAIGYLLLLADAAGTDPTDFGGIDLPARLAATLGDYEPGLYGAADPTYDGVLRQSLALLGLDAHHLATPASARNWLLDQQCGAGSDPAAVGGWQAYRADTGVPCGPPDPDFFSGPDSNSTALAVQALAALGLSPVSDPMAALAGWQESDGGFAFIAGGDVDPNSTALVIQAIVADGQSPTEWAQPGGDPYTSLLGWQLGCGEPAGDVGAFASPYSDGAPDGFATWQAVWGAAGRPFPFGTVTFGEAPVPCLPPTTTTTTPGGGPTSSTTSTVSTLPVTTPRFTG